MRWPPDSRKARLAPGLESGLAVKLTSPFDKPFPDDHQEGQLLLTAIPTGRDWAVKMLSPDGEIALLGRFDSRLPALGAALLISARVGGRAVP